MFTMANSKVWYSPDTQNWYWTTATGVKGCQTLSAQLINALMSWEIASPVVSDLDKARADYAVAAQALRDAKTALQNANALYYQELRKRDAFADAYEAAIAEEKAAYEAAAVAAAAAWGIRNQLYYAWLMDGVGTSAEIEEAERLARQSTDIENAASDALSAAGIPERSALEQQSTICAAAYYDSKAKESARDAALTTYYGYRDILAEMLMRLGLPTTEIPAHFY